MEKEKSNLSKLKKDYNKLTKDSTLPSFEKFNADFQIEKLSPDETMALEREMRREISEKFSNYLKVIETLLQPTNATMFIFSIIKKISKEDQLNLQDIYQELSIKELETVELDLEYDKEKEMKFLENAYKLWQEQKPKLMKIFSKLKNLKENKEKTSSANYFS